MTTITKEQVAHIAHLSRLEIQESEVDGYIEKLEKVVDCLTQSTAHQQKM